MREGIRQHMDADTDRGRTGGRMKLRDFYDMEEYLENRCYCPGEIYSFDGFFFRVFKADEECCIIAEGEPNDEGNKSLFLGVCSSDKAQILWVMVSGERIDDIVRIDATENNIKICKTLASGGVPETKFDEYEKGATERNLKQLLGISDAIIVS